MPDQTSTNLVMNAMDTTSLINTLSSLYSNATNHLITVSVGVAALIGIIVPILVAFYQNRSLREEREALSRIIENEVSLAKTKLIEDFKIDQAKQFELLQYDMEAMKAKLTADILKVEAYLSGTIYTTLSLVIAEDARHLHGFSTVAIALTHFAKGEKEVEMRSCVEELLNILDRLISNRLKLDANAKTNFENAISSIEKLNINNRYFPDIKRLTDKFNELQGQATK